MAEENSNTLNEVTTKLYQQGLEEQKKYELKIKEELRVAEANDNQTAITRINERSATFQKYHDLRMSLQSKIIEQQEAINATEDAHEKKQLEAKLEAFKKESEFNEVRTRAAQQYEIAQNKIGNIIDDITDPIKYLKRKTKEMAIDALALKMKKKGIEDTSVATVSSPEGVSGGGVSVETESYYSKMLGFMTRLTTSTEDSTKEQVSQNKKDSRTSAAEESAMKSISDGEGAAVGSEAGAGGGPDVKKKKKGMMSSMMDKIKEKAAGKGDFIKGFFGKLLGGLGSVGKMIMGLGKSLLIPLVTTPIGWSIILGGIAIGLLWSFKDKIMESVGAIWDGIKEMIGKVVGFITDMFKGIGDFYKKILKFVLPESVYNFLFGGDDKEAAESDKSDKELADKRMGGDQAAKQENQKDVFRQRSQEEAHKIQTAGNPHFDEPWGPFYESPRKPTASSERAAIYRAKVRFQKSKAEPTDVPDEKQLSGPSKKSPSKDGGLGDWTLGKVAGTMFDAHPLGMLSNFLGITESESSKSQKAAATEQGAPTASATTDKPKATDTSKWLTWGSRSAKMSDLLTMDDGTSISYNYGEGQMYKWTADDIKNKYARYKKGETIDLSASAIPRDADHLNPFNPAAFSGKGGQQSEQRNQQMEGYALGSVPPQGKGAQPQGTNNVVNAPTTNITNNTIEDRSFNNDPTVQGANPWGFSNDF